MSVVNKVVLVLAVTKVELVFGTNAAVEDEHFSYDDKERRRAKWPGEEIEYRSILFG